jgi:hypothetical protein
MYSYCICSPKTGIMLFVNQRGYVHLEHHRLHHPCPPLNPKRTPIPDRDSHPRRATYGNSSGPVSIHVRGLLSSWAQLRGRPASIHPLPLSAPRQHTPNTYSYVQEENSGSTRKSVEIYLLFTCITNLILAIHMKSVNGLEEPF